MKDLFVYHVVTEKPMHIGQHIIFDNNYHNGVSMCLKHLKGRKMV